MSADQKFQPTSTSNQAEKTSLDEFLSGLGIGGGTVEDKIHIAPAELQAASIEELISQHKDSLSFEEGASSVDGGRRFGPWQERFTEQSTGDALHNCAELFLRQQLPVYSENEVVFYNDRALKTEDPNRNVVRIHSTYFRVSKLEPNTAEASLLIEVRNNSGQFIGLDPSTGQYFASDSPMLLGISGFIDPEAGEVIVLEPAQTKPFKL